MNRILCLCTLLLGVTVQQQSLRILINSRIRNTINMSCIITGHPRVTNEEIIFHLNGTSVSEIQDLRPVTREDRGGTINIVVEIGPRSEGNFTCASCSNLDVCSTRSNMVGPIAANPQYSENNSVPLFYIGQIGRSVTLYSIIPQGSLEELYSYMWFNGTNHNVNTKDRYIINADHSLSINSLQISDAGRFLLHVQVNTEMPFNYRNNSYQLHVQEPPVANSLEPVIIRIVQSVRDTLPQLITCNTQGYPNLSIQWTHNNLDVLSRDDKYQVTYNQIGNDRLSSTLQILNLNSTDNGEVRCIACITSCNPTSSINSCDQQIIKSQSSITTLGLITGDFQYRVLILDNQNIELRIILEGNPIPVPVRVYIRYTEESTERTFLGTSQGTFTNTSHINLYIPNHFLPEYTRFMLKVALGTNTNTGPFKAPIKDIVYDINNPDDVCETVRTLVIVLPCILGLIVVTVIITTSLAIIHRQRLINKLKIEAKEVAEKCVDQDAKGDVKIEQFERYFPKAYRTLADGTDESSTDSSDASGKANYDTHDKSLTVDVSPRVEADSITRHRPNRISAEWIQATDQILCFMRDKKKKLQIMHHLSTAIRDDNNYWSRVNINSISTHTTV